MLKLALAFAFLGAAVLLQHAADARQCANPPYVSCANCSVTPWPTESSATLNIRNIIKTSEVKDLQLYDPGKIVYYKTYNNSWVLTGETAVTCQANGSWTGSPVCEMVCSTPSVVNGVCSGATLQSKFFRVREQAKCVCNAGYIRSTGVPNPTCKDWNQWLNVPTCKLQSTTPIPGCDNLPTIAYGTCKRTLATATGRILKGENVTCTCNNGYFVGASLNYAVIATSTGRCDGNNRYINLPVCMITTTPPPIIKTCPRPNEVDNTGCKGTNCIGGTDSKKTFNVKEAVTFMCNPGYEMVGNPTITCQVNGTWSKYPRCVQVATTTRAAGCGKPPVVANGLCAQESGDDDNDVDRGRTVSCMCNDEDVYIFSGDRTLKCGTTGWVGTVPTCTMTTLKPICSLSFFDNFPNGYCESAKQDGATEFDVGEKVICTCDNNYLHNGVKYGKSEITCTANNKWSANKPTCTLSTTTARPVCVFPSEIAGGYCEIDGDEDSDGLVDLNGSITCQCSSGKFSNGNGKAKCAAGGAWSPALPACVQTARG